MHRLGLIIIPIAIIILSSILVLQSGNNNNDNNNPSQPSPNFKDEEYFYIHNYKLDELPVVFCVQDFIDENIPNSNDILLPKMEQSVQEWENKIVQYTRNSEWNFEFRIISTNDESTKPDCDATFIFEPTPPEGQEETRGETFPSGNFSGVVIFYLDPINNKEEIASDIDFIIKHEIGHVLGLDHPIFDDGPYVINESDIPVARSIMVSPENYYNLPDDMKYEITEYDIRAIVNLYDEEFFKK